MSARTLIIAEAANPEWASVPLIGWSLSAAIAKITPAHLVTQVRNRSAILKAGLEEGRDFTAIDSEALARPLARAAAFLRGNSGVAWTTGTALAGLAYYYFEQLVWKRFARRIAAREFDVVHRVTPLSPTIPSLLALRCRRAGVPFVLGPLNGGVAWPKGFEASRVSEREWLSYVRPAHKLLPGYRSSLESAAALIAGSRDTLRQIPPAFRDKCIYLPENAVDLDRFSLAAEPSAGSTLRACFVGRLVSYKGPDMLLEAVAPLVRAGRLRLDIVGDGPLMPALRALASREGIDSGVVFHGWIDHRSVQQVMCRSQLLLFPSIREFGGGVVLEAMALGVVPVVVDYAGPGELVTGETGVKLPIGPRAALVAGLRAAVTSICERPAQLAAMSQAARTRVRTLFTWDKKAQHVAQIYDWVLGRRDKPAFFDR